MQISDACERGRSGGPPIYARRLSRDSLKPVRPADATRFTYKYYMGQPSYDVVREQFLNVANGKFRRSIAEQVLLFRGDTNKLIRRVAASCQSRRCR